MAPTTLTTIVLILIGLVTLAMAAVGWFGSWQPVVRRPVAAEHWESDYEQAVQAMRRAIAEYERGERTL